MLHDTSVEPAFAAGSTAFRHRPRARPGRSRLPSPFPRLARLVTSTVEAGQGDGFRGLTLKGWTPDRRAAGARSFRVLEPFRSLLLLILLAVPLVGCSGSKAGAASSPSSPPPEVAVRHVAEARVPWTVEASGYTAASHEVEVRARVGGFVVGVPYPEGERVAAGALLFEIDPRPFLAVLAMAEAEVVRAEAALRHARKELGRAEGLSAQDAIAREELERRRTDLETAGAALSAARARREAAALDVEFTRVTAPVAGRVGRARVRPGNLISGGDSDGTLLTTLVAETPLHVHLSLDEPAYQRLLESRADGRPVRGEVLLGQNPVPVEGRLDYLAPFLDFQSGTAEARLVVENADGRLAPGMFARVTLLAETGAPRIVIPETAVGAQLGSRYVLVVGPDNQVEQRPVILGERHGADRLVQSGLRPGESIVVNGLQRVRPGMTVQPVESALAAHNPKP